MMVAIRAVIGFSVVIPATSVSLQISATSEAARTEAGAQTDRWGMGMGMFNPYANSMMYMNPMMNPYMNPMTNPYTNPMAAAAMRQQYNMAYMSTMPGNNMMANTMMNRPMTNNMGSNMNLMAQQQNTFPANNDRSKSGTFSSESTTRNNFFKDLLSKGFKNEAPAVTTSKEPLQLMTLSDPYSTPSPALDLYSGKWVRDRNRLDTFVIEGGRMKWSRQPTGSPDIMLGLSNENELIFQMNNIAHVGHMQGGNIKWNNGDVWSREKAESKGFFSLPKMQAPSMMPKLMDVHSAGQTETEGGASAVGTASKDGAPPPDPLAVMPASIANAPEGPTPQQQMHTFHQQMSFIKSGIETVISGHAPVAHVGSRRMRDLAFVHVPCNFGHTVEKVALQPDVGVYNAWVDASFKDTDKNRATAYINLAQQTRGGAVWGMMDPELRTESNETGCDLYYTPPKYWPADTAARYFGYNDNANRTVIGILRDPYDRIVNEFRLEVIGISSIFEKQTRRDISMREGTMEREGPVYKKFYAECDVNGWVKAELTKVKQGDRFRGNCHMLPQADYFDGPHGINLPVDSRLLPISFNEIMERHGYNIHMNATFHNFACDLSAYSLDDEAKALVKEVYSRDLDLLCKQFGYCDRDELTCLSQFPGMCAGAPGHPAL